MIRNLNKLDRVPEELREGIFEKLFEVAEIAKFSHGEVQAYEDSLKSYRDLKNSLDTAREEGLKEGLEEGLKEGRKEAVEQMARSLIKENVAEEIILSATGLSQKQLNDLKERIKSEG